MQNRTNTVLISATLAILLTACILLLGYNVVLRHESTHLAAQDRAMRTRIDSLSTRNSHLMDRLKTTEDDASLLLKTLVEKTYPEVGDPTVNEFRRVNTLRQWAYENTLWYADTADLEAQKSFDFYSRNAASLFAAYIAGKGGVLCGGAAFSLKQLYGCFGFRAYTVDSGKPGVQTHVVTLVAIKYNGQPVLSIQDPTFDLTYVHDDDSPFDYLQMLGSLKRRQERSVRIKLGILKKSKRQGTYDMFLKEYGRDINEFVAAQGYPADPIYLFMFPLHISDDDISRKADLILSR